MILESQEHGLLYEALSKAQAEFPTIRVNRKAYKNEYADLYAILKPIYPILEKYKLCVMPVTGFVDGKQVIGARLGHASNQFITNVLYYQPDTAKNGEQQSHKDAGHMTYMHRNFIKNILGVVVSDDPEDNDMQPQAPQESRSAPYCEDSIYISRDQYDMVQDAIGSDTSIITRLLKHYQIDQVRNLKRSDFMEALNTIRHIVETKKNAK